ncbi:MAG TPA: alpha/beta hydrolase [Kofleriaceae bacterium]|nr:alpha/beta hydrolase [Kofleriaceae bacterium]
MTPPLHVVRAGRGPTVVLVHGSATDHATWTIQIASSLTEQVRLVAYDRRGTGRSPAGDAPLTVERHADDLAALIAAEAEAEGGAATVVGSSFGAAVVLEACRRAPARVRAAVLIEPPLAASDDAPALPVGFLPALDRLAGEQGPEAAAERFLRTVLGDAAFERLPRAFQARSKAQWTQIRADSAALAAYQVGYDRLGDVTVPVRLLGGERSAAYFRPTLEALARALPRATLVSIAGGGHMLHAEAPRAFHQQVLAAVAEARP